MSSFERGPRIGSIDPETYSRVRDYALSLLMVSGVTFVEPTMYDTDFSIGREVTCNYGIFKSLAFSVRVGIRSYQKHNTPAEDLQIVTRGYGLYETGADPLYRRKFGMTRLQDEVVSSFIDLSLPRASQIPEQATPTFRLPPTMREDFEAWEREIVGLHTSITPTDCNLLISEIDEIKNLLSQ